MWVLNVEKLGSVVCLFVLRFNIPVNNLSVTSGRSHHFLGFNLYYGKLMRLAEEYNMMLPVEIKPRTSQFRVYHRTPPCVSFVCLFVCVEALRPSHVGTEPTLHGFNQYCWELMCLAQVHNTMTPVGIEPRTSRFGVRRSTTTPQRSHVCQL